jgi:hypothetical protein
VDVAPPPGTVAKKPKKPSKPTGSSAKPEGSAKPASDDDVLGTRN